MPKLPAVSSREAIRAFEKAGFVVSRTESSHCIVKKEGFRFLLSIPCHRGEDLKSGTLRSLIRDAGLTIEEFIHHLSS